MAVATTVAAAATECSTSIRMSLVEGYCVHLNAARYAASVWISIFSPNGVEGREEAKKKKNRKLDHFPLSRYRINKYSTHIHPSLELDACANFYCTVCQWPTTRHTWRWRRQVPTTRNNYANILIFFVSFASLPFRIEQLQARYAGVGEHTIFPLYDNKNGRFACNFRTINLLKCVAFANIPTLWHNGIRPPLHNRSSCIDMPGKKKILATNERKHDTDFSVTQQRNAEFIVVDRLLVCESWQCYWLPNENLHLKKNQTWFGTFGTVRCDARSNICSCGSFGQQSTAVESH